MLDTIYNETSMRSTLDPNDCKSIHIHNLGNGLFSLTARGILLKDNSTGSEYEGNIEFPRIELGKIKFSILPLEDNNKDNVYFTIDIDKGEESL